MQQPYGAAVTSYFVTVCCCRLKALQKASGTQRASASVLLVSSPLIKCTNERALRSLRPRPSGAANVTAGFRGVLLGRSEAFRPKEESVIVCDNSLATSIRQDGRNMKLVWDQSASLRARLPSGFLRDDKVVRKRDDCWSDCYRLVSRARRQLPQDKTAQICK